METKEKYLTTKELTDVLQIHAETVRRWRAEGMPHLQISERRFRFRLSEVIKWQEDRMENKRKEGASVNG